MDKVAVVTDSVASLPKELANRHGIRVLPLSLAFGDRVYRDGVDLSLSEFYELLVKAPKLPTTSAPPPGDYLETYRELGQEAKAILCVTVASRVSAVFNSARLAMEAAKEIIPEVDIRVVDSGTAAGAQGLVVLEAARAAAGEKSLDEVVEVAQNLASRVHCLGVLDTLYYLAKGGRVPKVAAWATSLLKIKPLFQIAQGEVGPVGRPRTRARAITRLLELVRERSGGKPLHVTVMHANCPQDAEELKAEVEANFDCVEIFITEFTPVLGAHSGPGVLGLAFYSGNQSGR